MSGDRVLSVLSEVQDRLAMTKSYALGNSSMSQIGHDDLIVDLLGEQISCPELTLENQRAVLQYYLYTCAFWGFSDLVSRLIEFKADVNFQNAATRWTPLHAAVFQEHSKVTMILLNGGADVSIKDSCGRTPLDFASISPKVWYLFEEQGHLKTPKQKLIDLHVLKEFASDDIKLTPHSSEKIELSNRSVRSAQIDKTERSYKPSWGNDSSRMKAVFGGAE
ncbi:ankyrin repeat domain-containing protein 50-like isoform X2 [Symsagittifera roscoffensis]|uniref:ankyrin repeat domain-containing protein 50-like isoform X2 n=1 Tax=Symsagittifera roscoffensis TaxID=84072 RepID=UPI00307B3FD9